MIKEYSDFNDGELGVSNEILHNLELPIIKYFESLGLSAQILILFTDEQSDMKS